MQEKRRRHLTAEQLEAGANVKAVQRMLGHACAAMTLDRYADLFDDDLNEVADRLHALRAASRGRVADFCGLRRLSGAPRFRRPPENRRPDGV